MRTLIGVNDPQAVKKWASLMAVAINKASYWSKKFVDEGKDSRLPIQRIDDLQSGAGDEVTVDLLMPMNMEPLVGDQVLDGKEQPLKYFTDRLRIDQVRGGADLGSRMTKKRTLRNLRQDAKRVSTDWWKRLQDELYFIYLSGKHYTFDDSAPKSFEVYPPAQAGIKVRALIAALPTDCEALGDDIDLDDIYEGPLIDWILLPRLGQGRRCDGGRQPLVWSPQRLFAGPRPQDAIRPGHAARTQMKLWSACSAPDLSIIDPWQFAPEPADGFTFQCERLMDGGQDLRQQRAAFLYETSDGSPVRTDWARLITLNHQGHQVIFTVREPSSKRIVGSVWLWVANWKAIAAGLVLAALVSAMGVQTVRLAEENTQIAEGLADLASYKATAAESTALALRAVRAEETRLQLITRKVIDEARSQTLTARADAERADAAAARLSKQLAAARAGAKGARADSTAAGGGSGEPSADPIGVFAGLLERADRRAGAVERYADALRIAGATCERYADGLQPREP